MKKENIIKGLIAGLFSAITIAALTLLTYKTQYGIFLIASFGSSMVLLYGYPESPFAQPKNILFGHVLTTVCGMFFLYFIPLTNPSSFIKSIGIILFLILATTKPFNYFESFFMTFLRMKLSAYYILFTYHRNKIKPI